MSVVRRHIGDAAVAPNKLHAALKDDTYLFEAFNYQPRLSTANGYSAPTGTTGDTNLAFFKRLSTSYHVKGTQTLLGPLLDVASGLDVSQDQTDNDGVEHLFGAALGASNPFRHVIGTDPDKYIKLTFTIADVSGTDDCAVGFRKVEAFQANLDDYDEMACLNVISGDIKRETILNNAATTTVDTTLNWADGESHTLQVVIKGTQVLFYVDGALASSGAAFNFDSGEVVVPFFFFLQATTSPGKVFFEELEIANFVDVDDNYIF